MLYHASPTGGLTVLTPHVSNHGHPLVYFSKKRENVLVYLSNAVEKYCRDTGFVHTGRWEKWGPYGFDLDGVQRLEEYYPNALEETYAGVSGYIYGAEPANTVPVSDVPFAVTSEEAVAVVSCEFVPDAYEAILRAEREGLLRILHYAQTGDPFRAWIWQTMNTKMPKSSPTTVILSKENSASSADIFTQNIPFHFSRAVVYFCRKTTRKEERIHHAEIQQGAARQRL